MTAIPDDIMQTVGKILGKPEYSVRAANYDAVSLKLALALLAERERGDRLISGMALLAAIQDAKRLDHDNTADDSKLSNAQITDLAKGW